MVDLTTEGVTPGRGVRPSSPVYAEAGRCRPYYPAPARATGCELSPLAHDPSRQQPAGKQHHRGWLGQERRVERDAVIAGVLVDRGADHDLASGGHCTGHVRLEVAVESIRLEQLVRVRVEP